MKSGVTWRPQAADDKSVAAMTSVMAARRSSGISSWAALAAACAGAVSMALAFPKINAIALAPIGAIGLFWAWFGLPPRRAFLVGWAAGSVFFAITYAWFGETAGALIAPFGFFLALGPGIGDALFAFALPAMAIAALRSRVRAPLYPLAAAAIFAFAEWFRCEGLGQLGVPFGALGYTQVASPFAPLGAFVGVYGITFALCVVGAYAAWLLAERFAPRALRATAIAYLGVVGAIAAAGLTWPARGAPAPNLPVAAIQANIAQPVKFSEAATLLAIERYSSMSLQAKGARIVLWPETVIPRALNGDAALQRRFGTVAKTLGAELIVGSFDVRGTRAAPLYYNALFFFAPSGALEGAYRKRQLVPFAEHLPFERLLSWIPWTSQISRISSGSSDGLAEVAGMRFAPVICWESAFSGLVVDDVRHGATLLGVATDDAWFGTTAGPYQHAQIAQMRAIETGRWIVRAAATGSSGIVAPDGTYRAMTALEVPAVLEGNVGAPVTTFYDAFGPVPVALALLALVAALAISARPRSAA